MLNIVQINTNYLYIQLKIPSLSGESSETEKKFLLLDGIINAYPLFSISKLIYLMCLLLIKAIEHSSASLQLMHDSCMTKV